MVDIVVDKEKCVGCGTCVDTCPVSMYRLNEDKVTVSGNLGECVVCRACEAVCPAAAIEVKE